MPVKDTRQPGQVCNSSPKTMVQQSLLSGSSLIFPDFSFKPSLPILQKKKKKMLCEKPCNFTLLPRLLIRVSSSVPRRSIYKELICKIYYNIYKGEKSLFPVRCFAILRANSKSFGTLSVNFTTSE